MFKKICEKGGIAIRRGARKVYKIPPEKHAKILEAIATEFRPGNGTGQSFTSRCTKIARQLGVEQQFVMRRAHKLAKKNQINKEALGISSKGGARKKIPEAMIETMRALANHPTQYYSRRDIFEILKERGINIAKNTILGILPGLRAINADAAKLIVLQNCIIKRMPEDETMQRIRIKGKKQLAKLLAKYNAVTKRAEKRGISFNDILREEAQKKKNPGQSSTRIKPIFKKAKTAADLERAIAQKKAELARAGPSRLAKRQSLSGDITELEVYLRRWKGK